MLHNHDNEPGLEDRGNRPSMYDHSMPDELMWDDLDSDFSINPQNLGLSTSSQNAMSTRTILSPSLTGASRTRERTPLLRKAVSFHDSTRPSPLYNFQNTDHRIGIGLPSDTMSRQQSGQPCVMLSSGPAKNIYGGKSTFGQTVQYNQHRFIRCIYSPTSYSMRLLSSSELVCSPSLWHLPMLVGSAALCSSCPTGLFLAIRTLGHH